MKNLCPRQSPQSQLCKIEESSWAWVYYCVLKSEPPQSGQLKCSFPSRFQKCCRHSVSSPIQVLDGVWTGAVRGRGHKGLFGWKVRVPPEVDMILTRCLLWRCIVPGPPAPRPERNWTHAHDSHPASGWWSGQSPSGYPDHTQSDQQSNQNSTRTVRSTVQSKQHTHKIRFMVQSKPFRRTDLEPSTAVK